MQILRDRVVFEPLPVSASGTATARFPIVVDAAHPCPDSILLDLYVEATGSGCQTRLPIILDLDPACGSGGGVQARPGEVPRSLPVPFRLNKILPFRLRLEWDSATNADAYNIYRGNLEELLKFRVYDHIVSTVGAGICDQPQLFYEDPKSA